MIDLGKRMIAKSITWRLLAFIVLSIIAYFSTGSVAAASAIAVAYHMLQIGLYFLHEKVWSRIKFGRASGLFIQMTGMSGSGKTTLAQAVAERLKPKGFQIEIIDGDEYRSNLCKDLGFSKQDRNTNVRRLGFVGRVLARNSVISIMSAINPYEEVRNELAEASDRTKLVYIKCSLPTLRGRDPKGLYRRAFLPEDHPEHIPNFTGISDPFEEPANPDLVIDTDVLSLDQSVELFENFILRNVG